MMKYFTSNEIRKERLDICRQCDDYFKPTGTCKKCGCFMRVKTTLSFTECPIGKWKSTKEIEQPKDVPEHLVKEVLKIMPDLEKGQAKDHETKAKLIELYNTIYGTNYKVTTNCRGCLNSVWKGITAIYNKNK